MAGNDYNAINLRLSHPTLYRAIMTFAILSILLGINFLLAKPTFNPYGIDYMIIGVIFIILGMGKVIFLNLHRSVRAVRILMSGEIGFMVFWAIGTTITFFQGKTSLQLFILYVGLTVFEAFLLFEPFSNPITATRDTSGDGHAAL
jgi:hypothetical protein